MCKGMKRGRDEKKKGQKEEGMKGERDERRKG